MGKKGNVKVKLSLNDKLTRAMRGPLGTMKSFGRSVFSLQGLLLSGGIVYGLKKITDASKEQENAERKLVHIMKTINGATDEQINALKEQASALQTTTRYGDEATLASMALLGTYKLNSDAISKLTPLALDMAEALEVDAKTAFMLLGRAVSGQASMLTRYGIQLSETEKKILSTGTSSEKVAALVEVLGVRFGGTAEAMGKSWEGVVARLSNSKGDIAEVFGALITNNESAKAAITSLSESFEDLTENIKGDLGEANGFVSTFVETIAVGIGEAATVIFGLAKGTNSLMVAWSGITGVKNAAQGFMAGGAQQAKLSLDQMNEEFDKYGKNLRYIESTQESVAEGVKKALEAIRAVRGEGAKSLDIPGSGKDGTSKDAAKAAEGKGGVDQAPDYTNLFNVLDILVQMNDTYEDQSEAIRSIEIMTADSFDARIMQIDDEESALIEKYGTDERMAAWIEQAKLYYTSERLKIIGEKTDELTKKEKENLALLDKWTGKAVGISGVVSGTMNQVYAQVGSTLSTGIVDGMWEWEQAGKAVLKSLISVLAQMLLIAAVKGTINAMTGGSSFGIGFVASLVSHSGTDNMQPNGRYARHHDGLPMGANEYMGIFEGGEGMVNKRSMQRPGVRGAVNALNNGQSAGGNSVVLTVSPIYNISTIDSNGFEGLLRKNNKALMNTIKQNLNDRTFKVAS